MYEVERYTSTNDVGTAVLFEALIDQPVRRVVTASSMSVYGEGLYRDADGAMVEDAERKGLRDGLTNWEPVDARGRPLTPMATPEWKRPSLNSIYALNKYVQERTTHIMAIPYGMEGVCLRLFNVYGPGQALSNPYTGVLAIFASRLLNGQQPMIFEDGEQRRDFVHVTDVARAFADALVLPQAVGHTFNVGSGKDRSVTEVATDLAKAMGKNRIAPEIVGKARIGDIRHCFCDTSFAAERLGFEATAGFWRGAGRTRRMGCAADGAGSRCPNARRARDAGARRMTGPGDPRPVLVTGGAGFIGSNLVNRLAAEGHKVIIYDALSRAGVQDNLDWLVHAMATKSRRSSRIFATSRGWLMPPRARRPSSTWRPRSP